MPLPYSPAAEAPALPPPPDPLWDAVAYLSGAIERLAVGHDPPRERVLYALELVRLVELRGDALPTALRERMAHVNEWVAMDPSLREQSDRDVLYLTVGIVRAYHEAVRAHTLAALATAAMREVR